MTATPEPAGLTVCGAIHFGRRGRGGRKELHPGPAPVPPELGRVPRVARLMALAIRFDGLIRDGAVTDHAELARLGHVTRARVSQVMSILHLAPDIQEQVLFLPRTEHGRDRIILRDLLPIAATTDWRKQRAMWAALVGGRTAAGG
jgi:hypothetical protein